MYIYIHVHVLLYMLASKIVNFVETDFISNKKDHNLESEVINETKECKMGMLYIIDR